MEELIIKNTSVQILQNFFAFIVEDSGAILTSLSLINHTASEEETDKVL